MTMRQHIRRLRDPFINWDLVYQLRKEIDDLRTINPRISQVEILRELQQQRQDVDLAESVRELALAFFRRDEDLYLINGHIQPNKFAIKRMHQIYYIFYRDVAAVGMIPRPKNLGRNHWVYYNQQLPADVDVIQERIQEYHYGLNNHLYIDRLTQQLQEQIRQGVLTLGEAVRRLLVAGRRRGFFNNER